MVIFLGFLLLQIIPLPGWLVQFISPKAFSLHASTIGQVSDSSWFPLSINKHATLAEFFRLASYCGIYFLTVQLLTRRKYLVITVKIIVTIGALIAVQAMLQRGSSDNLIYWFRTVPANAAMQPRHIRRFCKLNADGEKLLEQVTEKLGLSARSYSRILKVARTIADLAGSEQIENHHLAESIQYRCNDRPT